MSKEPKKKLTEKQRLFVEEYLIDLNATQAALRAGYSSKTAYSMGNENLKKPQIKAAIERRMKVRENRTEITQDMVIQELAKIAFADSSAFAKVVSKPVKAKQVNPETGEPEIVEIEQQFVEIAETDDLSPDQRAAISGIKETKFGIAVESYDKTRALELLGKHLNIFTEKVEHTGDQTITVQLEGDLKDWAE